MGYINPSEGLRPEAFPASGPSSILSSGTTKEQKFQELEDTLNINVAILNMTYKQGEVSQSMYQQLLGQLEGLINGINTGQFPNPSEAIDAFQVFYDKFSNDIPSGFLPFSGHFDPVFQELSNYSNYLTILEANGIDGAVSAAQTTIESLIMEYQNHPNDGTAIIQQLYDAVHNMNLANPNLDAPLPNVDAYP